MVGHRRPAGFQEVSSAPRLAMSAPAVALSLSCPDPNIIGQFAADGPNRDLELSAGAQNQRHPEGLPRIDDQWQFTVAPAVETEPLQSETKQAIPTPWTTDMPSRLAQ